MNTENKVSVFNWRLPFNAVQCLLKKRTGYKRAILMLMLIVALGDRMVLSGKNIMIVLRSGYKRNLYFMIVFFKHYQATVSFICLDCSPGQNT